MSVVHEIAKYMVYFSQKYHNIHSFRVAARFVVRLVGDKSVVPHGCEGVVDVCTQEGVDVFRYESAGSSTVLRPVRVVTHTFVAEAFYTEECTLNGLLTKRYTTLPVAIRLCLSTFAISLKQDSLFHN